MGYTMNTSVDIFHNILTELITIQISDLPIQIYLYIYTDISVYIYRYIGISQIYRQSRLSVQPYLRLTLLVIYLRLKLVVTYLRLTLILIINILETSIAGNILETDIAGNILETGGNRQGLYF